MTQNGIAWYGGNQPAESIVLSGGYEDDIDDGDTRLHPRGYDLLTHHARTAPSPPTPVSALRSAGKRKEITMNHASPGIVVGFAGQP